jgi:hypothetical protein
MHLGSTVSLVLRYRPRASPNLVSFIQRSLYMINADDIERDSMRARAPYHAKYLSVPSWCPTGMAGLCRGLRLCC